MSCEVRLYGLCKGRTKKFAKYIITRKLWSMLEGITNTLNDCGFGKCISQEYHKIFWHWCFQKVFAEEGYLENFLSSCMRKFLVCPKRVSTHFVENYEHCRGPFRVKSMELIINVQCTTVPLVLLKIPVGRS